MNCDSATSCAWPIWLIGAGNFQQVPGNRQQVRRQRAMANIDTRSNRPLSPHLQVYKMLFTMLMSIVHRITGTALYFGTILMVYWLLAGASGPEAYNTAMDLFGSFLGRLILFGFTWALMHHMLGGIRHFIWDTGRGLDAKSRNWLARATLAGSLSLTLILWIIGYAV